MPLINNVKLELLEDSGITINRNGDDLIWNEDGESFRLQRKDVKNLVLELNNLLDELKKFLKEIS